MTDPAAPVYCANHPGVETNLRCNHCGKPICARCAVRTPTGYRCKECVRDQQKIFDTSQWVDYLLGSAVAVILGFLASLLATFVSRLGIIGWIVIVIGAPSAGMLIAEVARLATRKHRSRPLFITIAAAVVVGALPVVLFLLFTGGFFTLIFQGIYLFMAVPIVYTRLSGIQMNR
jgi:hypothetical protein